MFTRQLEIVQRTIDPGNRPSGCSAFPILLREPNQEKAIRLGDAETVREWFVRIVDDVLGGDTQSCTVEENLALFLVVRWDKQILHYATAQVLWTEASLEDYYLGENVRSQYFRLDYEPPNLGRLFKESLPHVHVAGNGEPRFPLHFDETGDVVGGFIDFIYRNYFHADWLSWASNIWSAECGNRSRPNAWARIVGGYERGDYGFLEQNHREDLLSLKRSLVDARGHFFPLRARGELCQLLSYC